MNRLKKLNYYLNDVDKYLALAGIILGIIAAVVLLFVNDKLVPAPVSVAIFSFLYLLNRDYNITELSKVYLSNNKSKILFIAIFILINLSTISFIFRPELYSRPLTYFVLISVVSGLLAVTIFYLPLKKKYEYLAMFSILLIGFSLRIIPQLLFPDLVGIDPWRHQQTVNSIMDIGHIVDGFVYSRLPTMHLCITATSFLTGLNYKWSSVVSVMIPQIISLIIVYLIGYKLFNPKIGLIAALILSLSANYISLGFWIHPTAFALILSTFLFYFLIRDESESRINKSILILFAFLIIATHMQVPLAIIIALIAFYLGKIVYNKILAGNLESISFDKIQMDLESISSNKITVGFIVLFAVIMYSWWIYVANNMETPTKFISMALQYDPSQMGEMTVSTVKTTYNEYILNIMPYLFFYGFSILGCFYAISKKSNSDYLAITFSGVALLAMPFILLETNMAGFLAERWIYSAQLLMSITVAVGVTLIFKITQNSTWNSLALKSIFIIILISSFAFVNVTNPSANNDNNELSKNYVKRSSPTLAELQSINTIRTINGNNTIYTDLLNTLPFNDKIHVKEFSLELKKKKFPYGVFILRSIIKSQPIHQLDIDYDPFNEFSIRHNFERIYDSGSEIAFLKT